MRRSAETSGRCAGMSARIRRCNTERRSSFLNIKSRTGKPGGAVMTQDVRSDVVTEVRFRADSAKGFMRFDNLVIKIVDDVEDRALTLLVGVGRHVLLASIFWQTGKARRDLDRHLRLLLATRSPIAFKYTTPL